MKNSCRILIIDDDLAAARLLQLGLERNGTFQVRVESDGRRACEVARAFQPHAILLDIVMPHLDGGDVAAELHRQHDLAAIPIIFLTSLISTEEADKGPSGGYVFLSKPIRVEQVTACLEELIACAHSAGESRL